MTTTPRNFAFPVSTLIRDAKLLLGALADATVGPAVLARLTNDSNAHPDAALDAQIQLVETGGAAQSGAAGDVSGLTQAQARAFNELERLMSAGRRSGTLAFPAGDSASAANSKSASTTRRIWPAKSTAPKKSLPP